ITMRALLVCPPVVTLSGPQTASGGTVTVRLLDEASLTVVLTVPDDVLNVTVLLAGVGLNPMPARVMDEPVGTWKYGAIDVSANCDGLPETSSGNSAPPRGVSTR